MTAKEQINLRLPHHLREWIHNEKHRRQMSQNDLLISILENASKYDSPSLFDEFPAAAQQERPVAPVPFTFIDLFAGIGGFRLGLERSGGQCVFTSEWDVHSQKTYRKWYGEKPEGDITKILPADIPDHDVLAAGFPCQPFSIAGVSKKQSLGREHGFRDATQGTMFFYLASIIEEKRPPVVLLENVKNLMSHDGGRTWQVIRGTLEDLNYEVHAQVINARHWVPQHRERVFIVAFDKSTGIDKVGFRFPEPPKDIRRVRDILDPNPPEKYTLTDHLWKYLQDYAAKHKAAGNGFGYGLVDLDGVTRTLSARYHKDGSEILIPQPGKNPRRLTPRECARLMGFPDEFPIEVSDTQAYRQFGNALCPLIAEAVGKEIATVLAKFVLNFGGCLIKGRVQSRRGGISLALSNSGTSHH